MNVLRFTLKIKQILDTKNLRGDYVRIAIITAAGISSRFNEGVSENNKQLKVIYQEDDSKDTLLYHLINHCSFADEIILVGGYKYDKLKEYVEKEAIDMTGSRLTMVFNCWYEDLASGYSFYLGLQEALKRENISEILYVEGDLDIDKASFQSVIENRHSVITYNHEPIYSNKSVALYQTQDEKYHYVFSSSHDLLKITEPFKCILNSGQLWKFKDINTLKKAYEHFDKTDKKGTNLSIIQDYLDNIDVATISLIPLQRWINCNTREDFTMIRKGWRKFELA
ncbi:hypothetical protein D7X87_05985 [bacterium D16-54]|nr:hypothetical protein D7X87_05985 [bacterium D16-54]RKJ15626.1 hypothetical protein D7X65_05980 [bacterium D16-56]